MALSEIENQLSAGHVVFRHARGRTVVFVAIVLIWARSFLVWHPIVWLDVLGGLIAAFLACTGIIVAVQAVRGTPLLEASETGIAINTPWGAMFLHWRDAAEFSAGKYRWLRIRLREGRDRVRRPGRASRADRGGDAEPSWFRRLRRLRAQPRLRKP